MKIQQLKASSIFVSQEDSQWASNVSMCVHFAIYYAAKVNSDHKKLQDKLKKQQHLLQN
jgi:hypothetical protein